MKQSAVIDEVRRMGGEEAVAGSDVLDLEWFEIRKQLLKRETRAAFNLTLRLKDRQEWHHGDGLFCEGRLVAVIQIKPCLTIQFATLNTHEAADFCYYIGNRHLPVYLGKDGATFMAPYDGRLFEQLQYRYPERIRLENQRLLSEDNIREKIKHKIK